MEKMEFLQRYLLRKGWKTTITIVDENGTHTQEVLDGTNGTPGTNGVNGKTTYFHVKYSNDGGKTFTSNSGETVGAYIGTCTDYNAADPTSVGSYIWAKIKGDDGRDGTNGTNGKDGKGISKIQTFYQANNSTSGIYTYTSGWSETFTAPSSNSKYLWTYQKPHTLMEVPKLPLLTLLDRMVKMVLIYHLLIYGIFCCNRIPTSCIKEATENLLESHLY